MPDALMASIGGFKARQMLQVTAAEKASVPVAAILMTR